MAEKETIFSSKIKYKGVFSFKETYIFCHKWLSEETGLDVAEEKYAEKISGDIKEIDVAWKGTRKVTDYFKYEVGIAFTVKALKNIEVNQGGAKISANSGDIEIGIKGTLVRDYDGKFETNAFNKFLRGIYEKWVIPSRVEEYKAKLAKDCDEFLNQSKAYLDLEGKK